MDEVHYKSRSLNIPRPSASLARFLVALLLASAIDKTASWMLEHLELTRLARVFIAILPVPGNVTLIAMILRRVRKLDEFQQRVHFEAVVVAFLSTGVAVFIYGFLQAAQVVGPLNSGVFWIFMLVFYAIG